MKVSFLEFVRSNIPYIANNPYNVDNNGVVIGALRASLEWEKEKGYVAIKNN